MNARNRSCASPAQVCRPSSFSRQPPRVLIVDASPPWWSDTSSVLCEALDNFLTLASSLEGPSRLPLLSLYAVNLQQECLLPFVQVKGNLARLHSCVEELRSLPREGCTRPRGDLLKQAVLDSLQQFKQYMRHATVGGNVNTNSIEVTVLSSQPGRVVLRQLEEGLRDSDLVSLRRLLVVHIAAEQNLPEGDQTASPGGMDDPEESLMLSTEMDLQQVENSVVAMESVLKAWLHDQVGDREHLHLLLPPSLLSTARPSPVCLKCDVQERLLSPALLHGTPDLGAKTESVRDFQPPSKALANQSLPPQRLRVIKALRAEGVCQSVLYGLPLVIRPTTCWQLDWDEMETNHQAFHALCHALRTRDWFLLVCSEPALGCGSAVSSHYVLQPSASLSLLLKPVVTRELLLPCHLPACSEDPPPSALATLQSSLGQLEEDPVFNPLCLGANLYPHLRMRGLRSWPTHPYRPQGQSQGPAPRRDAQRPPEGRAPPQPQQGRQSQGRVRATVAPLPTNPAKVSRPPLTLSRSRPRTPALCLDDDDDDLLMML